MNKKTIISIIAVVAVLAAVVIIRLSFLEPAFPAPSAIISFEECVKAGYSVMESQPIQCETPDGRIFFKGEDGPEVCSTDCGNDIVELDESNDFKTEDVTFTLGGPNGYDLNVRTVRPKLSEYSDKKFSAVLIVGGGWGAMTPFLNQDMVRKTSSDGVIFVAFDSPVRTDNMDGRKPIINDKRDYKGFKDQADVAFVLEYIFKNPNVNTDVVGVWSSSSGALLTSGVLGRYSELGESVAFWMDDEGPSCPKELLEDPNLSSVGGLKNWAMARDSKVGEGRDYKTEEEFWYERCGDKFIGNYKGIYQRIQGINDHALRQNYPHAIAYLNAATNGNAKWTRLNIQPKDVVYKSSEEPNGAAIENGLDIKSIKQNKQAVWNMLFKLIKEIQK